MSKKLDPAEKVRRKKLRDRAYYLKHYDEIKGRLRTQADTWRKNNPEKNRAIYRRHRKKLRQTVIAAYGGRCVCCEIDDWRFLSIDHIDNDGAEHRRNNRYAASAGIYGWLKSHEYPSGFQVLCYNCNIAKYHFGGVCPHQINPSSANLDRTN